MGAYRYIIYGMLTIVSRSQIAFFRFYLWWRQIKTEKSGLAMRDYANKYT